MQRTQLLVIFQVLRRRQAIIRLSLAVQNSLIVPQRVDRLPLVLQKF